MATNYLSASLLSPGYQTLLDADNREAAKQLSRAIERAKNRGSTLDANTPLRDDNGTLLSFSDEAGESTENTFQTLRIHNGTYKINSNLIPSVLQEKMDFNEFKLTPISPTIEELLSKEEILDAKIKEYTKLIEELKDG